MVESFRDSGVESNGKIKYEMKYEIEKVSFPIVENLKFQ